MGQHQVGSTQGPLFCWWPDLLCLIPKCHPNISASLSMRVMVRKVILRVTMMVTMWSTRLRIIMTGLTGWGKQGIREWSNIAWGTEPGQCNNHIMDTIFTSFFNFFHPPPSHYELSYLQWWMSDWAPVLTKDIVVWVIIICLIFRQGHLGQSLFSGIFMFRNSGIMSKNKTLYRPDARTKSWQLIALLEGIEYRWQGTQYLGMCNP